MKRYYLSPVVEEFDPDLGATVRRTTARKQAGGLNYTEKIGLLPWGLVIAAGADHTGLVGHAELGSLPDVSLDTRLSAQNRNAVTNACLKLGVAPPAMTSTTTLRQVVDWFGNQVAPGFDANRFDAKEPA